MRQQAVPICALCGTETGGGAYCPPHLAVERFAFVRLVWLDLWGRLHPLAALAAAVALLVAFGALLAPLLGVR